MILQRIYRNIDAEEMRLLVLLADAALPDLVVTELQCSEHLSASTYGSTRVTGKIASELKAIEAIFHLL